MNYKRKYQDNIRKPVSFTMYHILLVKTHGVWCIDSQSWNESEIIHARREENRLNPLNQCKIVTSPSDDERVVKRILNEMNRFASNRVMS